MCAGGGGGGQKNTCACCPVQSNALAGSRVFPIRVKGWTTRTERLKHHGGGEEDAEDDVLQLPVSGSTSKHGMGSDCQ